jgi:hypothetical protein
MYLIRGSSHHEANHSACCLAGFPSALRRRLVAAPIDCTVVRSNFAGGGWAE